MRPCRLPRETVGYRWREQMWWGRVYHSHVTQWCVKPIDVTNITGFHNHFHFLKSHRWKGDYIVVWTQTKMATRCLRPSHQLSPDIHISYQILIFLWLMVLARVGRENKAQICIICALSWLKTGIDQPHHYPRTLSPAWNTRRYCPWHTKFNELEIFKKILDEYYPTVDNLID